jgi:hypothetical protein
VPGIVRLLIHRMPGHAPGQQQHYSVDLACQFDQALASPAEAARSSSTAWLVDWFMLGLQAASPHINRNTACACRMQQCSLLWLRFWSMRQQQRVGVGPYACRTAVGCSRQKVWRDVQCAQPSCSCACSTGSSLLACAQNMCLQCTVRACACRTPAKQVLR